MTRPYGRKNLPVTGISQYRRSLPPPAVRRRPAAPEVVGPRDDDAAAGDTPLHVDATALRRRPETTLGGHPAKRLIGAVDSPARPRVRILTAPGRLPDGRRQLFFARLKGSIPSQRCRHHGTPR